MSLLDLSAVVLLAAGWVREGNLYRSPAGDAELEWVSESSFRLARARQGKLERRKAWSRDALSVAVREQPASLHFRTRYLEVEISKETLALEARDDQGRQVWRQLAGPAAQGAGMALEAAASPDERFFGLGTEAAGGLDRRGRVIETGRPFLLSSAGYGLYFPAPGRYIMDLAAGAPDRVRMALGKADRLEYFFYLGPTPKEVLEQHSGVEKAAKAWNAEDFRVLAPGRLPAYARAIPRPGDQREAVRSLLNAAFSAWLAPAVDLDWFRDAAARGLCVFAPILYDSGGGARASAEAARRRLAPYLWTYVQEAADRGLPVIRPMAMQYPKDPETWKLDDQFMLGDELLVAPLADGARRRPVYLPMGIWTELGAGQAHQGRRRVELEALADAPIVLARNGAIVPFEEPGGRPMALHYFPRLGGEFFLYEPPTGDISQFHAAPAGDYLRLEIESLVDRDYEWVVHHQPPPKEVSRVRRQDWSYQAATRTLRVRVKALAGQDVILNVSF